jgi:pimeloyl-ACP methyl ester carboxylesterase
MNRRCGLSVLALLPLVAACAESASSPTPPSTPAPWIEEGVNFRFGANLLYGILTLPTGGGPYPAIVLVSGSAETWTRVRSGASSQYFIDHARKMALRGFAVLRYDPPGVGRSTGESGFESLDLRAEEAAAALQYLRSRPDIRPDRVGLWGGSQGGWVIAMAAARCIPSRGSLGAGCAAQEYLALCWSDLDVAT